MTASKTDDRRELSGNTAAAYTASGAMRSDSTTADGAKVDDTPTRRRVEVDRCRRYWSGMYGDGLERWSRGFHDWSE